MHLRDMKPSTRDTATSSMLDDAICHVYII